MLRSTTGCMILMSVAACTDPGAGNPFVNDTVTATQLAVIGEVDGAEQFVFGNVAAVAADDSANVYVADGIASVVKVYDKTGGYLGTIGRAGSGPGEFRYLRDLHIDQINNLHVRGAFRISVFTKSTGRLFTDSLIRTLPVRGIDSPLRTRGKVNGPRYYIPSYTYKDFLIRGYFYVALDSTGQPVDTLWVPAFPNPETTGRASFPVDEQGRGQGVEGVNRAPFEAVPSWDITTQGHILTTVGNDYSVSEVAPTGDTIRTIRYVIRPRRSPQQEAQDSGKMFKARLDSIPVPIDRMRGMSDLARRGEMPNVLPEILAIHAAADGSIWLRRWPRSGKKETIFDVYSADGKPLQTVLVPADLLMEPLPWISANVLVGVISDSATQTQRVAIFGLRGR